MATGTLRLRVGCMARCAATQRPRCSCPFSSPRSAAPRRGALVVRAAKDKDDVFSGAIKTASGLVDKAADLVPENVPRPAAKAGVSIAGIMVVFWLLNKVISGVVTLAVVAGLGYYFLTQQGKGDDGTIDVTPTPTKGKGKEDLDDPLAEARRIMDKYK